MQSELVRFEHISIRLDAAASAAKQSKKTIVFQMKFDVLHDRFLKKEINAMELPSRLLLLTSSKNK